jgi:hypothetical protein
MVLCHIVPKNGPGHSVPQGERRSMQMARLIFSRCHRTSTQMMNIGKQLVPNVS